MPSVLGAEAITRQWRTCSGKLMLQRNACMPPRLPPITAAHCWMPSRSASRAWIAPSRIPDQRERRTVRLAACRVDAGRAGRAVTAAEIVEADDKKRLVSIGLPGPIMLSHQPGFVFGPHLPGQ